MGNSIVFDYLNGNPWAVRGLLIPGGRQDNCISTARIMSQVLAEFGIVALPVTARVVIASTMLYDIWRNEYRSDVKKFMFNFDRQRLRNPTQTPLFVTVGYPDYVSLTDNPDGWAGHLVNFSKVNGVWHMIDFSIDQINGFLIEKGFDPFDPYVINLDSMAHGDLFPVERTFGFTHNNLCVEYRIYPEDLSNEAERLQKYGRAGVAEIEAQEAAAAENVIGFLKRKLGVVERLVGNE